MAGPVKVIKRFQKLGRGGETGRWLEEFVDRGPEYLVADVMADVRVYYFHLLAAILGNLVGQVPGFVGKTEG